MDSKAKLDRDHYNEVLADYDALCELVTERIGEIGAQYKPHFRSHHISELTKGTVWVMGYWPDYETENYSFPADWLFADNWQQLVDEKRTDEARALAEQKAMAARQQEDRERREFERLKAKFGGSDRRQ